MKWTKNGYEIDDDRSRIDMDRIVAWLAESYWARAQSEAAVRRSWHAAGVTLGLYDDGGVIGCARAVTDFTRFAYLLAGADRARSPGRAAGTLGAAHQRRPRALSPARVFAG